jgi:hypothetical protein
MCAQQFTASEARKITRSMADYFIKAGDILASYLDGALRLPDDQFMSIFPLVQSINQEYSTKKVQELREAVYGSKALKGTLRTHCSFQGSG